VTRATVHVATLDHQALVGPGEVAQRLGGVDRLAGDERDRRRADEQLLEPIDARVLGGALDQRVLGDAVGRAVAERPAQGRQLGHREAAVLGDHRGGRAPEVLGDLLDRRDLVGSGHPRLLSSWSVFFLRFAPTDDLGNDERPGAGAHGA
jgi:hypothetical protein